MLLMQAGGALIGPHALGVIKDVEAVRHIAELGVVFLLFNIGLELSLERLQSMQKYVFGLGTSQVSFTGGVATGSSRSIPLQNWDTNCCLHCMELHSMPRDAVTGLPRAATKTGLP